MRLNKNGNLTIMKSLKFALAGKVVSKSKIARDIWIRAIRRNEVHLIPQARSVQRKLLAVGQ